MFGGVYFVRTLGRSDAAHLYSAIPPVCLLLAHGLHRVVARARLGNTPALAVAVACFGLWMLFMGGDRFLDAERRGQVPLASLDGRVGVNTPEYAAMIDGLVESIRAHSRPGDRVLDMSASPLVQVLAGRLGPGYSDLVMPGTFLDEQEERAFIARLEADPPAVVLWPERPFDDMGVRRVQKTAPELSRWVRTRYREGPKAVQPGTRFPHRYTLLLPRARGASP